MKMKTYYHAHLCCGLGGLSAGIQDARASHLGHRGRWECIGAVDVDPATVEAYNAYTGTRVGRVLDLMPADQYHRYHGHPPPAGWREATPDDLRRACGGRRPHLVASSPPCRGFSSLVSASASSSARYGALNELVVRALWLALEAWEPPPDLLLLENVPGITSRGADHLQRITSLLTAYGYAVSGGIHDLGEIGGLAQHRRRYFLAARHRDLAPAWLRLPPRRPLRTVGEVLGALPPVGDPAAGPLHRPRRTSWRTAVRLALIPAGGDWRALRDLDLADGRVRDYVLGDVYGHRGALGVLPWDATAGTVTGRAGPTTGTYSVADPRAPWEQRGDRSPWGRSVHPGVLAWDGTAGTVVARARHDRGRWWIGDPRVPDHPDALGVWVITSRDGTWHRPLTDLELGALQSLWGPGLVPDLPVSVRAGSEQVRRWIGNAVPRAAARALGEAFLRCLLASAAGSYVLSNDPIWAVPPTAPRREPCSSYRAPTTRT